LKETGGQPAVAAKGQAMAVAHDREERKRREKEKREREEREEEEAARRFKLDPVAPTGLA
jgi:hypothetical protein